MLLLLVAFFATFGNAGGTTCEGGSGASTKDDSPDTYTAPTMNRYESEDLNLPSNGNYAPSSGTRTRIDASDLTEQIPHKSEDKYEPATFLHEWGGTCTCPSGEIYQVSTYPSNMVEYGQCGEFACKNGIAGACNKKKGEWSGWMVTCASVKKWNPHAESFHSISKLFDGYNILLGNPLPLEPELLDPGFTYQIFQNTDNQKKNTMDWRYMIPDNVDAESCSDTCAVSMTAQLIRTEASYKDTLKESVKWDAWAGASTSIGHFSAGFSAAFSGSNAYETMHEGFTKQQSQYVMSTATCCSYKFQHQHGGSDSFLTERFVKDVLNLPPTYNEKAYASFVNKYGTHYVQEVTMGSKYVEIDRITTADMNTLDAQNINVLEAAEVNACASFGGIASASAGAGHSSSHSTSPEEQKSFQHSIAENHVVSLGAPPPKDASARKSWAESVVNNPQPIALKLGDISHVLSKDFVKNYGIHPADLEKRKANLDTYMLTYCERMKNAGLLAKYAQCPCNTNECCKSRDFHTNICELLSQEDYCRKTAVCKGCNNVINQGADNNPTCGEQWQWLVSNKGFSENDAKCKVKNEAPEFCGCLKCNDAWTTPKPIPTPEPIVSLPSRPNYALVDGGPGSDKKLQDWWMPNFWERIGEVQCCKDGKCTRRNPWNSGKKKDCMSGHKDGSKFSLQEARDMCNYLGDGWRLCTRSEVDQKICNKKGCSHDSAHVWVTEQPERNIVEMTAGGWGGTCTCPDGSAYEVGDNHDWCGSLACVGGISGECRQSEGSWSYRKVTCVGTSGAEQAVADEENSMKARMTASLAQESDDDEKSMMATQIADDKVNVALGFFAVIGGCAIMYNAAQAVRKFACEQKWTPIGEEDV